MHVTKIDGHIHLIDLELNGIEEFIASYVLEGEKTAIIETGPASTVQNLLSGLDELGVKLDEVVYVAVSHIHLDHAGAAGTLMKYLPKAELVVHERGAAHVANPGRLWNQAREVLGSIAEIYGRPEPVPEDRIVAATEGAVLNMGNSIKLKAIETLGHASHHLSYYETLSDGIFAGDAAGIYLNKHDAVVPTTPPPFRLDIALASLEKLIKLRPAFLYYSHFGKAYNATQRLQDYAKQLKIWAQTAKQGIKKGGDIEAVSRNILESDIALRKVADYIKEHPILSKTVLHHSVEGVTRFVNRFGSRFG